MAEDLKIEKPYRVPASLQLPALNKPAVSRILLVEDNRIAQLGTKAILSTLHCSVDIAANGEEALLLFKQNLYDLILMDIGLGEGMDGYEVTYCIRNLTDLPNTTPIIALTAHAGDENRQCCLDAGMDAVLTKPLTQLQAIEILTTFIYARQKGL